MVINASDIGSLIDTINKIGEKREGNEEGRKHYLIKVFEEDAKIIRIITVGLTLGEVRMSGEGDRIAYSSGMLYFSGEIDVIGRNHLILFPRDIIPDASFPAVEDKYYCVLEKQMSIMNFYSKKPFPFVELGAEGIERFREVRKSCQARIDALVKDKRPEEIDKQALKKINFQEVSQYSGFLKDYVFGFDREPCSFMDDSEIPEQFKSLKIVNPLP